MQEVKITGRPGNKHDIQIEKWKVSENLFIYENLKMGYLGQKNGTEAAYCAEKWLIKRIPHTAGI